MNRLTNERGAALVLTLILLTITILFVMTLFYKVVNTTKQVKTMDEHVQAQHVADMGLVYYEQIINQLSKATYESVDDFIASIPKTETVSLDSERSFNVSREKIDKPSDSHIDIYIRSEGSAFNRMTTKETKLTVHVDIEKIGGEVDASSDEAGGLVDSSGDDHGGTAQ